VAEHTATLHKTIRDVNRNQWNNLVEQSDLGSVFHRYEWLLAIEDGLGHEPSHVVVQKNGNPIGLFPNFVMDLNVLSSDQLLAELPTEDLLPAVVNGIDAVSPKDFPLKQLKSTTPGFGGPIVASDESECLERMFQKLSTKHDFPIISHTIKAKELGYMRYGKTLAERGYSPTLLDCRFELNLDYEFDELVDRMDRGRRKSLLDARQSDYEISELSFDSAASSTYNRYVTDMERADGTVPPKAFFEQLSNHFSDRLKIFSAEVDGIEVGRYVYVVDDEQSTLHYFYSAIGDESNFEYNPTELLHGHAIEWAQANGYQYYDFGSTGSTFLDGAFRYKERYGGRVIPTLQWMKGYNPLLWTGYKLGRRAYQRLAYGNK